MTSVARILQLVLAAACMLCTLPALAHEMQFKTLWIGHPHVFEPEERLPRQLPLFMTIRNAGQEPDRLIGVECPFASSATFVGQEAPAAVVQGIPLPAASEVTLRRSGAHVVLQDIKESLEGYQYLPLTLTFERAGRVELEVYVEDRP